MDRVAAANLTYEDFVARYKAPGVPVIIEGWLDEASPLKVCCCWC